MTTKTLADLLTALRFCLAGFIIWLGINGGAGALPLAAMALVLAWITDLLDGPLARRDPAHRPTWIGDHDLEVDISVGFAVLVYLALSGYLTLKAAIGYAVVCAALMWRFRSPHLGMAIQAPPYGGIIYAALRDAPKYGLLLVGYVALVVIATWPRFPQVVVPQFLAGMRNLGGSMASETQTNGEDYVGNGNGNGHRLRPL